MTRREYISGDLSRMALLIEIAQNDGLAAKGCFLYLSMPPTETQSWKDWLGSEYPEEWDISDMWSELQEMERAVDEAAMKK